MASTLLVQSCYPRRYSNYCVDEIRRAAASESGTAALLKSNLAVQVFFLSLPRDSLTVEPGPVQCTLMVNLRYTAADAVHKRDCHCGCNKNEVDDDQLGERFRRDRSSVNKGLQ